MYIICVLSLIHILLEIIFIKEVFRHENTKVSNQGICKKREFYQHHRYHGKHLSYQVLSSFYALKERLMISHKPLKCVYYSDHSFCSCASSLSLFCFSLYRLFASRCFCRFKRSFSAAANSSGVGSGTGISNLPINFK